MTSKEFFFHRVIQSEITPGKPLRVLELGCGTAPYVPEMLTQFPELEYVGIEPIDASYQEAATRLDPLERATVHHQLGYDAVANLPPHYFDVVISFSVLEHVKQLERFIAFGAEYAKPGALVVHRYDLGHALHSNSLKERFHVWLGNSLPKILPERKFVRYVPMSEVEACITKCHGMTSLQHTFHQVPDLKKLDKALQAKGLSRNPMHSLYAWEFDHAETFAQLPTSLREQLFPSVAVWGRHVG